MSATEFVIPCNSEHSIKEAVISIFLVNPIVKPARFEKLISSGLSDSFQQFQKVANVQFQVQNKQGEAPSLVTNQSNDAGFVFIGFENGKQSKILQGKNEPDRTFISYHSTNYKRWADFYSDYIKYLNAIIKEDRGLFVSAISVHYVDQFKWVGEDKIDLTAVFKSQNEYFPNVFFKGDTRNYLILTEMEKNSVHFLNRIEVFIDEQKNIVISHNIVSQINIENLESLLEGTLFKDILQAEHDFSKQLLSDILVDELAAKIKLK